MKINKNTKLWFECTLGKKSHINTIGKVIFSPLIIYIGILFIILDFLFLKETE